MSKELPSDLRYMAQYMRPSDAETVERAADEIERARASGWQPIETAPKEGRFEAFSTTRRHVFEGYLAGHHSPRHVIEPISGRSFPCSHWRPSAPPPLAD